jgi:hypothetical protein
MDRQKAALAVVAVEQGEALMPVHDIGCVVDIQGDGGGWPGVAGAIEIDHGVGHAHHLAFGGRLDRLFGAQAQRDTVGCEHRSPPLSGRRL